MTTSSLHSAMEFERAAIEEIQHSLQAHLALEQAVLAQVESAWAPAVTEAAAAGMDLDSYVAALSAGDHGQAHAEAEAEAAAAGMDLDTYVRALSEAEAAECAGHGAEAAQHQYLDLEAHALAEHEAAAAGMDLETYMAVLAEVESAEVAQLQAQGGDELDAATIHALAEEEAAQAGMDLSTYVAALQEASVGASSAEQAVLEALAYQEGLALHQAELEAEQAELAAMHGLTPYEIGILQHQQLAQHHALGLLG